MNIQEFLNKNVEKDYEILFILKYLNKKNNYAYECEISQEKVMKFLYFSHCTVLFAKTKMNILDIVGNRTIHKITL